MTQIHQGLCTSFNYVEFRANLHLSNISHLLMILKFTAMLTPVVPH